MAHSVFLSHAHEDNKVCDSYFSVLESHGFNVWYDRNNLQGGRVLSSTIEAQLRKSSAFIVMLSSSSVNKHWVTLETDAYRDLVARDSSRLLLPVRISYCDVPQLLRPLRWIDAVNRPFQDVINEILRALGSTSSGGRISTVSMRPTQISSSRKSQEGATEFTLHNRHTIRYRIIPDGTHNVCHLYVDGTEEMRKQVPNVGSVSLQHRFYLENCECIFQLNGISFMFNAVATSLTVNGYEVLK